MIALDDPPTCDDCGMDILWGAHSTAKLGPDDVVINRIYCDACYRFRQTRGLEFRPEHISVLQPTGKDAA